MPPFPLDWALYKIQTQSINEITEIPEISNLNFEYVFIKIYITNKIHNATTNNVQVIAILHFCVNQNTS
jgi:hypothetical protein